MATKIQVMQGPSCLTAADPDEPIFVLRANDELAPDIIRAWADRYMFQKSAEAGSGHSMSDKQLQKYRDAHKTARDMERWKKEHG